MVLSEDPERVKPQNYFLLQIAPLLDLIHDAGADLFPFLRWDRQKCSYGLQVEARLPFINKMKHLCIGHCLSMNIPY